MCWHYHADVDHDLMIIEISEANFDYSHCLVSISWSLVLVLIFRTSLKGPNRSVDGPTLSFTVFYQLLSNILTFHSILVRFKCVACLRTPSAFASFSAAGING